jgi:hypothetical protein
MSMDEGEREQIAESVTFDGDEETAFVSVVVAGIEWDEDRAIGRPEMSGRWRVSFRDSLQRPDWCVDLPEDAMEQVQAEVRQMVARRMAGDADLSGASLTSPRATSP